MSNNNLSARLEPTDQPIYVVSGLPRSGTSMMMQILRIATLAFCSKQHWTQLQACQQPIVFSMSSNEEPYDFVIVANTDRAIRVGDSHRPKWQ
jgi:hypothetical protein